MIRPMLAASLKSEADLHNLTYPLAASPKIDGIRFMKPPNSRTMSRAWKPLPNDHFQNFMESIPALNYCDGEVIVGSDPTVEGLFNKTQSAVMTKSGEINFSIWLFDNWEDTNSTFENRTAKAANTVKFLNLANVKYVTHMLLSSADEVVAYEEEAVASGYEGIMLRSINAKYKYGRSTFKEQGLIKIKRFMDEEATVIGFEPLERNNNEAQKDAFGLQKRSTHKANKTADNLLGKLIVKNDKWGEFYIGSGFDVEMREAIWNDKQSYVGKLLTFKYQQHGTKDKPRMPIFKGFRND